MSLSLHEINRLKQLLKIENHIKELSEALKKFRAQKAMITDQILMDMSNKKITRINLPGGAKLETKVQKKRASLNKKFIEGRLGEYCRANDLDYDELHNYVYSKDHRPFIEEVTKLKKTKK